MAPRPLVVVRPEPGNAATVAAARAVGLQTVAAPLFRIMPLAWTAPPAEDFDCLLLGSANAIRHAGPALASLRHLPVYAVGTTTAEAARAAGFAVPASGEGGLQGLLPQLLADGRRSALRLAGEERVQLEVPPGLAIDTRAVYRAAPLALADEARAAVADGAVVALHSAAAARHFAAECDRLALARDPVALACLGPRIAAAAGRGWGECRSAAQPSDDALLALAAQMCQTAGFGHGKNTTVS